MSEIKDGGRAFAAISISDFNGLCVQEGMSLRDWYAGMALQGLLANAFRYESMSGQTAYTGRLPEVNADCAYIYADAMLKARGEP